MDNLQKVTLSLASECFKGIDGSEEEIATKAYELFQDAMLETPTTDQGKEVKEKVTKIMAEHEAGIESPYFPKPEFDMNEHYGKIVNVSVKPVLEIIAKHSETLGRQLVAPTVESDYG